MSVAFSPTVMVRHGVFKGSVYSCDRTALSGREMAFKCHCGVIEFETHRREVDQCRLVEIKIKTIVGF